MRKGSKLLILFFLTFSCLFSDANLYAQEKQPLDSVWSDWNFRISPFFWYIGFQGTIYRPPQPVQTPIPPPPKYEIDVGFKDIKNSIKFALMLAGQYKSENVIAQFNFSSLILESEAITPLELILQDNVLNLSYFSGDVGVGYRVVKRPKLEFDAMLSMKFIYFKIGLKTNLGGKIEVEGERDKFWVDPAIGANLLYRPHHKIEFFGYADVGPAFPDNVFNSQAMLGVNYLFTKSFLITLGYRSIIMKFPKEEVIFDGMVSGWIMRIGFQF